MSEKQPPKSVGVKITPLQWRELRKAANHKGTTVATKFRELGLEWAREVNKEAAA